MSDSKAGHSVYKAPLTDWHWDRQKWYPALYHIIFVSHCIGVSVSISDRISMSEQTMSDGWHRRGVGGRYAPRGKRSILVIWYTRRMMATTWRNPGRREVTDCSPSAPSISWRTLRPIISSSAPAVTLPMTARSVNQDWIWYYLHSQFLFLIVIVFRFTIVQFWISSCRYPHQNWPLWRRWLWGLLLRKAV